MKKLIEQKDKFYLTTSIQDIATKNDIFYLQDEHYISEDETIFIKQTEETKKLFTNAKR